MKRICSMLMAVCIILYSPNAVYATNVNCEIAGKTEKLINYDGKEEAREYAEGIYSDMLQVVAEQWEDYGMLMEDIDKLYLGEPYIVYSAADDLQRASYYFPICKEDNVIFVINVSQNEAGWSATLGYDEVEVLNKMNYIDQGGVVYCGTDAVYIENNTGKTTLYSVEENIKEKELIEFQEMNYQEKKDIVANEDDIVEISNIQEDNASGTVGYTAGCISGNGYMLLSNENCYVSQGNYNLCWAASIATIYRYRTGNQTMTAKQVADRINVNYVSASDDIIKKGFHSMGLYYYKRNFLNYDRIKQNIQRRFPVMIIGSNQVTRGNQHAVTVMGYNAMGNRDLVNIWDSASESRKVIEYGDHNDFESLGVNYRISYAFSYK